VLTQDDLAHRQPAFIHPGQHIGRPHRPAIHQPGRPRLTEGSHPAAHRPRGDAQLGRLRSLAVPHRQRRVVLRPGLAFGCRPGRSGGIPGQQLPDVPEPAGQLLQLGAGQVIQQRPGRRRRLLAAAGDPGRRIGQQRRGVHPQAAPGGAAQQHRPGVHTGHRVKLAVMDQPGADADSDRPSLLPAQAARSSTVEADSGRDRSADSTPRHSRCSAADRTPAA
jgi:hypothetical protein